MVISFRTSSYSSPANGYQHRQMLSFLTSPEMSFASRDHQTVLHVDELHSSQRSILQHAGLTEESIVTQTGRMGGSAKPFGRCRSCRSQSAVAAGRAGWDRAWRFAPSSPPSTHREGVKQTRQRIRGSLIHRVCEANPSCIPEESHRMASIAR